MTTAPNLIREQLLALADELQSLWHSGAKPIDIDGFADRLRSLAAEPVGVIPLFVVEWSGSLSSPARRAFFNQENAKEVSALHGGARIVQMMAYPAQPDSAEGECPACHRMWNEHRPGYSASRCQMRPKLRATDDGKGEVHVTVLTGTYEEDGICDGCGMEVAECTRRFMDCERRSQVVLLSAAPKPEQCIHKYGRVLTNMCVRCGHDATANETQPKQPARDGVDSTWPPLSLRHQGVGKDKRGAVGCLYEGGWDEQAYAQVRDACAEWQRRALDAEENLRCYLELDNPTFMGDPVLPRVSAPRKDAYELLLEHSGCGYGKEVNQLNVSLERGDKVVLIRARNAQPPQQADDDYTEPSQQDIAYASAFADGVKFAEELAQKRRGQQADGVAVYVPGLWRCAKCEFQLMQSNLNANTGTVTARDDAGDRCPNCNSPLWRVTYKDAYAEVMRLFCEYTDANPPKSPGVGVDDAAIQRALDDWFGLEGGTHDLEDRVRMRTALLAALGGEK